MYTYRYHKYNQDRSRIELELRNFNSSADCRVLCNANGEGS